MKRDLRGLDIETLKEIYTVENDKLQKALLNGSRWEDMKEQRSTVTEISIMIHKRLYPNFFDNPAEYPSREDESHTTNY
jgi:hypothetical protein